MFFKERARCGRSVRTQLKPSLVVALIKLYAKQADIFCFIAFICFIHSLRFFNVGLF